MSLYKRANRPWQEMNGRALVLDPERASAHELNSTATFIWQKLETAQDLEQLTSLLAAEYDIEPTLARVDLLAHLNELQAKRLLE